jgi:hypothetical protein
LKQWTRDCKTDRALVGLDKASVVCRVDNLNPQPHTVHIVGQFVSDNLPPHTVARDAVIPAGGSHDEKIEFTEVNLGRSKNPHCVCTVTSSDGIAVTTGS